MIYANENDPHAAHWLSCLPIQLDRIDDRSITDVKGNNLDGFTQCHFFAGIGGWSYALQLAQWPATRPVGTGSCPCQPFSAAGKRQGEKDSRHLWPEFRRLIAECSPPVVFGEQVASKDGRDWVSAIRADMEALGYAVGIADLCAAGVGSPHIRQRIFWVAHSEGSRRRRWSEMERKKEKKSGGPGSNLRTGPWPGGSGRSSTLAVADVLQASYGVPGRVAQLRGLGNAIVPQVAAAFITSFMEAVQ